MKKRLWYIIPCIFIAGYFIWKKAPDWFNPRPRTLSTVLTNHRAVPVVRNMTINGFTIANLRASDLRDGGPVPYQSKWNNDLHFDLTWIEMFNEEAWHAEFTVSVEKLGAFSEEKYLAVIYINIGAGGDLSVTTSTDERLHLIARQRSSEITKEMDVPVMLAETCGKRLSVSDPRRQALFVGFEDWAVIPAKEATSDWLRDNPMPASRCSSDWSLKYE